MKEEITFSGQEKDVIDYIKKHGSITMLEAYLIGCGRLSARVYDLKAKGVPIKSELVKAIKNNGEECRVARYWIAA